jgi:hypothetical protein
MHLLCRQVSEVVEKNREEEQRLRREKSRLENILNSKILQFDEDMQSRTSTYNTLTENYNKEYNDFLVLKEHFDKIDADISRYNEEEYIISCVSKRAAFGNLIINNAATRIQKIFRGKRDREIVNKMKAKMKKGKKGKKSKK